MKEKDIYNDLFDKGQEELNNQGNQFNDDDNDEYDDTGYVDDIIDDVIDDEEEDKYGLDGDVDYGSGEETDEPDEEDMSQYSPKNQPSEDDLESHKVENKQDKTPDLPKVNPFDKPLFPGGPVNSVVDTWKRKWNDSGLRVIEIQEMYFIFRTLNRFEYKQIAGYNIDSLAREEVICETCTLWPEDYNHKSLALEKAGIPSTLSQIIMEESGFTNKYSISVL